ncbi:MAG TPA: hypothetical protein VJ742_12580 [Nitrososphaera sp.]|nr:hypothetical protein [Nitrososphaera sp.]
MRAYLRHDKKRTRGIVRVRLCTQTGINAVAGQWAIATASPRWEHKGATGNMNPKLMVIRPIGFAKLLRVLAHRFFSRFSNQSMTRLGTLKKKSRTMMPLRMTRMDMVAFVESG